MVISILLARRASEGFQYKEFSDGRFDELVALAGALGY